MIHPSISELTQDKDVNRYSLVVATAKCARIITDEYVRQREYAEKLAFNKESDKKASIAGMIKKEYRDEKAVKTAINGLYNGEFQMINPDGTVETFGSRKVDNLEEAVDLVENQQEETIDNFALDPNQNALPTEILK